MIRAFATISKTQYAPQLLKNVFEECQINKNKPIAFLSNQIEFEEFKSITQTQEEHLVYDFTEKTENGNYLNASISIPLASLLFIDLPDKSLYREGNLDIQHIRQMIIPLKYRFNVKDIYIDNFESVGCSLMGRDQLWRTNPSNTTLWEDWKDRQMEYKMALLFYMSRKFNLNFYIGMTWYGKEENPKDIRFMRYGNIFDMINEFEYIKTTENIV